MSVRFTNQNIYVQFIDDVARVTLASASTVGQSAPERAKLAANVAGAKKIGALAAQAAKSKGITRSFSTAAAPVITAKSRRWLTPRAKAD